MPGPSKFIAMQLAMSSKSTSLFIFKERYTSSFNILRILFATRTYILTYILGIWLMPFLVFGSCLFGIWFMPFWNLAHAFFGIWFMPFWDLVHAFLEFGSCLFWYLVHAFLGFGSCLFEIWLMPFLVFGSRLFGIWLMPFWNLALAYLRAQVKEFNENSQEPNLIDFFLNCAQVKTAPLKTA